MGNTMPPSETLKVKAENEQFSWKKKKFETQKVLKKFSADSFNSNQFSVIRMQDDSNQNKCLTKQEEVGLTDINNYDFLKTIGKGQFGKVLLVKSRLDDNFYALKCLKKDMVIRKNNYQQLKTEKKVLQKLAHPFIVKLHASFQTKNKIFMLFDYSNGGELFFHLQKKKRFSEECAKFFAAQLYLALIYIHENGILYRDLKPENIMLDRYGNIKLIDFGLAKDKVTSETLTSSLCGTSEYLPPEVIKGEYYGANFDWWGYGILLYEMIIGLPPFMDDRKKTLYKKIVNDTPNFLYFDKTVPISENAKDLISKLLAKNPDERIKPEDIPKHKFFRDINFHDLYLLKLQSPYVPKIKSVDDFSNFDPEFLEEDCYSPPKKNHRLAEEFIEKNQGKINNF